MLFNSTFTISGITCEACLKLIKRRVGTISGVNDINVDLQGTTKVSADRKIDLSEITKVLEGTDYQVNQK